MVRTSILQDASKRLIIVPKILLECVGTWPEDQRLPNRIVHWSLLLLAGFIGTGQMIFLLGRSTDIRVVAETLVTVFPTIQVIKCILLYCTFHTVLVVSLLQSLRLR